MYKYALVSAEPSALRTAREDIQQTPEDVEAYFSSSKTKKAWGVDADFIKNVESKKTEIHFGLLEDLAKYYNKTLSYFFVSRPDKETDLVATDRRGFKSTSPYKKLSRDTMVAIREARITQDTTIEYLSDEYRGLPDIEKIRLTSSPAEVANLYRAKFKVAESNKSSFKGYFDYLRAQIESLGILVVQAPFDKNDKLRGLAFTEKKPYLIVINSKDGFETSHAPRIFTLLHEFGHILTRDESLCNDGRNSREPHEVFCNRFASFFLMPTKEVKEEMMRVGIDNPSELDLPLLKKVRDKFRVGFDALMWRLKSLGFIQSEEEVKNLIEAWRKDVEANKPEFFNQPNIETKVRVTYGERFARQVLSRQTKGVFTPVEVAEILNVKLDDFDTVRKHFGEKRYEESAS